MTEQINPSHIPFIHRDGFWQVTGDEDYSVAFGASVTFLFYRSARLDGFWLDGFWDNCGMLCRIRHLRILIPDPDGLDWVPILECADLPSEHPAEILFDRPVSTHCARVQALEIHPPMRTGKRITYDPKHLLFSSLGNDVFRWIGELVSACEGPRQTGFVSAPLNRTVTVPAESSSHRTFGWESVIELAWLRVVFSLRRPAMLHFGWDSEGTGRQEENLLHLPKRYRHGPAQGPVMMSDEGLAAAYQCGGGRADAMDDGIRYQGVQIGPFSKLDLVVRYKEREFVWDFTVTHSKRRRMVAAEAWRWIWNFGRTMTCTLAEAFGPFSNFGKGRCRLPAVFYAPNFGGLSVAMSEGDETTTFLRVDSHRAESIGWTGLEIGVEPQDDGDVFLIPGTHNVRLVMKPGPIIPSTSRKVSRPLRRAWGAVFGFRPEAFGMANAAGSLGCAFMQHTPADAAVLTTSPVDMEALCRYSVELHLHGAAAYGFDQRAFMDSGPSLLIASAVLGLQEKGRTWAERVFPAIRATAENLLSMSSDAGLIVCPRYSGNSGERIWSSNWWDVITFGHLDAYSNALAYRGLGLAARLAASLGHTVLADRWKEAAGKLCSAYVPCFLNPATGWLGGWRSRDGQLHDYAFTFINGMAIVFGLVEDSLGREILSRLESQRMKIGFDSFHYGFPGNLLPVPKADTPRYWPTDPVYSDDGSSDYGLYENGAATMAMAYYYFKALSKHQPQMAGRLANTFLNSFEDGLVIGGIHSGIDWRNWDGQPTGYEGFFCDQAGVLLGIAEHRRLVPSILLPQGTDATP